MLNRPQQQPIGPVAQSVERGANNAKVASSTLVGTIFCNFYWFLNELLHTEYGGVHTLKCGHPAGLVLTGKLHMYAVDQSILPSQSSNYVESVSLAMSSSVSWSFSSRFFTLFRIFLISKYTVGRRQLSIVSVGGSELWDRMTVDYSYKVAGQVSFLGEQGQSWHSLWWKQSTECQAALQKLGPWCSCFHSIIWSAMHLGKGKLHNCTKSALSSMSIYCPLYAVQSSK